MIDIQIPEWFSSVIGLGSPRDYFPVKALNRWGGLVVLFLFLGGAAFALLYGLYEAYVWSQRYGPAVIDDRLTLPSLIAGVLVILGGLGGWSAYVSWKKGAVLFDRGLAYYDRRGLQTWRWDEVVAFYAAVTRHYTNGIYTGTTHVYTLVNHLDARLVLNDALARVEDLAKAIDESTYPNIYDHAAGQYNAGGMSTFGPVTISKSGIQIGKKSYPWSEVQQVSIRQGLLQVSKKGGGWFSGASASAAAIPNLRVLLSIIDQIVGINVK